MTAYICRGIWNASEATGLGLGRLAPWVFGGMVGALPHRLKGESDAL